MNLTTYLKPGILPEHRATNEGKAGHTLGNLLLRASRIRTFYRVVQDGPILVIVCRTAVDANRTLKLFKTSPLLAGYSIDAEKVASIELSPASFDGIPNAYKVTHVIVRPTK